MTKRVCMLLFTTVLSFGACAQRGEERASGPASVRAVERVVAQSKAIGPQWSGRRKWIASEKGAWVSPGMLSHRPHELAVVLPRAANDAFSVADAQHPERSVTLRPHVSRDARYVLVDGDAVASEIFDGVDEIVAIHAAAWESLYLVKTPAARHSFEWDLTLGADILGAKMGEDGSLLFESTGHEIALAIPAPVGVDAVGKETRATMTYEGATLRVSFDVKAAVYPLVLDPTITSWSWAKQESQAVSVYSDKDAFAYDEDRSRTVSFGGLNDTQGSLNDTFEWDGFAWSKVAVPKSPPGRSGHVMAYDKARKRLVMFGGVGATPSGFFDDTWVFNGSSWIEQTPATHPPPREGCAMIYDEARSKVVLFGGAYVSDTWEWDGVNWTQRTTAHAPTPRRSFGLAYDAERKVTVLHAGGTCALCGGTSESDTWEYDGTDWVDKSAGSGGVFHAGNSLVYDRVKKRVVRLGGYGDDATEAQQVKEWDGTSWKVSSAPSVPVYGLNGSIYDTKRNALLAIKSHGADVWESVAGASWKSRSASSRPTVPYFLTNSPYSPAGGSVYAPALGGVLFFGPGVVWKWNGSAWSSAAQGARPFDPSYGIDPHYVYDPNGQRLLAVDLGYYSGVVSVWSWNNTWTQLPGTFPVTPNILTGSGVTYDTTRDRIVLLKSSSVFGAPAETWEWGTTSGWTNIHPPSYVPTAFGSRPMAYDPIRHVVVTTCGIDGNCQPLTGTYEYDGTDWKEVTTPHHLPLAGGTLRFDPSVSKLVIFSVDTSMWDYDGVDWTPRVVANATSATPVPNSFNSAIPSFNYDGRALTLLTASEPAFWILSPNYGACAGDGDCPNGFLCTDAVCCVSKSCNTCETCNGITPGKCSPVLNAPDPDTCAGTLGCNDKGACMAAIGAQCTEAKACASGFCVDGVCCDTLCDGTCLACKDTLKEENGHSGVCGPALHATDIRNQCAAVTASTCGLDGTCDGKGACRLYPKGTICASSIECPTDGTATAQVCDGLGACGPQTPTNCNGFRCTVDVGCRTTCTGDGDCATNFRCDGKGMCIRKSNLENGTPCANAYDCQSGHCVDGVCCDTACDGICEACRDTVKQENSRSGVCGAVKVGTPESDCPLSDPSSCGYNGVCDGSKACAKYAKGTLCSARPACLSEGVASGRVCDGLGACGGGGETIECNGYRCVDGAGCKTSCATSNDCLSGWTCAQGACLSSGAGFCSDAFHVQASDGVLSDCGNYRCRAGACLQGCASVDDCRDGFVCGFDGLCVVPPQVDSVDTSACSFAILPHTLNADARFLLMPLALFMYRRHRRTKNREIKEFRGALRR